MARVSIYLPDWLYRAALEQDLVFSAACQVGLRAQLAVEPRAGETPASRIRRGLEVILREEAQAGYATP
jgi:hypothetical protein